MMVKHEEIYVLNSEREGNVNMQLRAAREASSKTQAQVAKEANVSERIYQEYEYDKSEPGVRTANRIARAVNSTAEILWGFGAANPTADEEPDGNPAE